MSRILALDIGTKRIGVAVSDPLGITAKPLDYIKNDENVFQNIKSLIESQNISTVVIGLPITLKGLQGQQVEYTKDFAEKLKQYIPNINIVFIDERFTTSLAEKHLSQTKKKKNMKEYIDSLSAVFILQTYLDSLFFGK
ncbi:Holliday junction resolvase RuvX [Sulfurihydrogenibium subterraneum]|uniref:Holliday junction resolvase RuvX n=1 Tax=Sulfurihydrogenibium subterraneum TaxID=171121 RepID=UPI00048AA60F|nr:Holliday junction resolvase RuvX [Sulfurihydrogenibium subterraneum]